MTLKLTNSSQLRVGGDKSINFVAIYFEMALKTVNVYQSSSRWR